MVNVVQRQWDHIRRVMMMTLTIDSYRKNVWDEHAAILEAIARRQVSRARVLAAAHARSAKTFLTASAREHDAKQPGKL